MMENSYSLKTQIFQYFILLLIILKLCACGNSKNKLSGTKTHETVEATENKVDEIKTIDKLKNEEHALKEDIPVLEENTVHEEKPNKDLVDVLNELKGGGNGSSGNEEILTLAKDLESITGSTPPSPAPIPKVYSIDKYKVGLETDSLIKLGGIYTLKVLVGPEEITLSFAQQGKVSDEITVSTKTKNYAIITPHTPGFDVEPKSTGCIQLDSTEMSYLFKITPTATGTFIISANVELFADNNCSGSKKATVGSELEITVNVADALPPSPSEPKQTTLERIGEILEDNFVSFVGSLSAMFFGYLIFVIRKKMKKKTGYDHPEGES